MNHLIWVFQYPSPYLMTLDHHHGQTLIVYFLFPLYFVLYMDLVRAYMCYSYLSIEHIKVISEYIYSVSKNKFYSYIQHICIYHNIILLVRPSPLGVARSCHHVNLHWLRFHHDSHDAIHLFLLFPQTNTGSSSPTITNVRVSTYLSTTRQPIQNRTLKHDTLHLQL